MKSTYARNWILMIAGILCLFSGTNGQESLRLNEKGYFSMDGLDVTVFSDFYPEGHQSGVTIIQHGNRVAANGDVRLEASPGQWSPVPAGMATVVDEPGNRIGKTLWYPDSSRNRKGFNPIEYPDLHFTYHIHVTGAGGSSFRVRVDLDEPLPEEWLDRVGFNLELFPGDLFGKTYLMDGRPGIFPTQPGGPMILQHDEALTEPMAIGYELAIAPEEPAQYILITSSGRPLELRDGRSNHNNGWFIVRSTVQANVTKGAIEWTVTPHVIPGWKYTPVIQVSQLGYHPGQRKLAVVELDRQDTVLQAFRLFRVESSGLVPVKTGESHLWGNFLRYRYVTLDFSEVDIPGTYEFSYGETHSHPFRIAADVYKRNTWQPTLEYYLPVQMCHMRVNEKYRVWHGLCHLDDALMAPTDHNHFDGYFQGSSTLCDYPSGTPVPGLNSGGWHDAGDYDLRVESQAGTIHRLAMMIEEFGLDYDATTVDQENKVVEIHQPDGKSDVLQQIEHGLAAILGGYRSVGMHYRGIICPTLRQYVMLGDAASMTDNLQYDPSLSAGDLAAGRSGVNDDRWVFTQENPRRQLAVAAALANAARVLRDYNPTLSDEALTTALALWENASGGRVGNASRVQALSELILTTGDREMIRQLVSMKKEIIDRIDNCGWALGRVIHLIEDPSFRNDIAAAVATYQQELKQQQATDSPYGVPYTPRIWGAGWNIQRFGVEQYFFHKGWPELAPTYHFENALHFILGVHPGINTASFASGVGANSVTTAYGVNRADWSFIPGGVASGTALIRPDLPELKIWPFFWQQTEYVMGGGATNFMFLVLAVDALYDQ
jgi:endoglucanase